MIYLYKDPTGEKLFEKTSTQYQSQVNPALSSMPQQQLQHSLQSSQQQQEGSSVFLSTLASSNGRERRGSRDALEEAVNHVEATTRGKDVPITGHQNASSSVDSTKM